MVGFAITMLLHGHRLAVLAALLAPGLVALGAQALAPGDIWLDAPLTPWHRAGADLPRGWLSPAPSAVEAETSARRCAARAAASATSPEAALIEAGWAPFLHQDRRIARDGIEVIGGMTLALPDCQPLRFHLFVFAGGRFAGTLSPAPMAPDRDGEAGAVRITGADALTAEFGRYLPSDPACCPSSRVRVTYRIDRSRAGPVVVATEVRRIR